MGRHVARFTTAVLVAAAFAVQSLLAAEVPDEAFWDANPWLPLYAISLAFGASLVEPAHALYGKLVSRHRMTFESAARAQVHATLLRIDKATPAALRWHEVGVHVWKVRRPAGRLFRPVLHKVAGIRLSEKPRATNIQWTKGKGVVGRCWEREKAVGIDLWSEFGPYYETDEATWGEADEELTQRLSWQELQSTRGYGGVLSAPILAKRRLRSSKRFMGCISADGPVESYSNFLSGNADEILKDAATVLRVIHEGDGHISA